MRMETEPMIPDSALFAIESGEAFDAAALKLFRFQARNCPPYRDYLALLGVGPESVTEVGAIPCLPIELFKSRTVWCGPGAPEAVFTSSSTTGQGASHHPMASLAHYERIFTEAFRRAYGAPEGWSLYGLLPSYLEREGSSLVYMVDRLIRACGSGGFFLHDHEALLKALHDDPKPKILLGVSYALWDLAERHPGPLRDTVVMETGGMKGQREELDKPAFHRLLCEAFGVKEIHSEYGMAELTSQAYSQGGNRFRAPGWMQVRVRDVNDPFRQLPDGSRGGLNIIDLANGSSCAFIQTQDVGRRHADGTFSVEGRVDRADIRGCNLLVQ